MCKWHSRFDEAAPFPATGNLGPMSFRGLEGASFPVTECLLRFRVGFRSSLQVHLPLVEKRKKRGERRSVNRFVVADRAIINSIQGRSITPRKTFSKIQRNRYSIYPFLQNELHVLSKKKKKKKFTYISSHNFQSTLVTQIRQPRVHLRDKNSSVSPHVVVNLYVNRSQEIDRTDQKRNGRK